LSATAGLVWQEERNNRKEINRRVKAFIELLLIFGCLQNQGSSIPFACYKCPIEKVLLKLRTKAEG
jgi:hypothetical protein